MIFIQYEGNSSVDLFAIYFLYTISIIIIVGTESYFNKRIFVTRKKIKLIQFAIIRSIIITVAILLTTLVTVRITFDLLNHFTSRQLYDVTLFISFFGSILVYHYYEKFNFQMKIYRLGLKVRETDFEINNFEIKFYRALEELVKKKFSCINFKKRSVIIKFIKLIFIMLRLLLLFLIVVHMVLVFNLRPNSFFSREIFFYSVIISSLLAFSATILIFLFEDKYMKHLNKALSRQKQELSNIKNNKKYLETRNYMKYKKEVSSLYNVLGFAIGVSIYFIPALNFLPPIIYAVVGVPTIYYALRLHFPITDDVESD